MKQINNSFIWNLGYNGHWRRQNGKMHNCVFFEITVPMIFWWKSKISQKNRISVLHPPWVKPRTTIWVVRGKTQQNLEPHPYPHQPKKEEIWKKNMSANMKGILYIALMFSRDNIVGLRIGYGSIVQRKETTTPSITMPTLLGRCSCDNSPLPIFTPQFYYT